MPLDFGKEGTREQKLLAFLDTLYAICRPETLAYTNKEVDDYRARFVYLEKMIVDAYHFFSF
jgi:hypothetical protein